MESRPAAYFWGILGLTRATAAQEVKALVEGVQNAMHEFLQLNLAEKHQAGRARGRLGRRRVGRMREVLAQMALELEGA